MFETVSAHFRQDVSLFWTRANFYLVVQAGLLSVTAGFASRGASTPDKWIAVGLCAIGLILAVFWYLVMRAAMFWMQNWREKVIEIDQVVNRFRSYTRAEAENTRSPWLRPSLITAQLPIAFMIVWIALGMVALLSK